MQGKKHSELALYALETLYQKFGTDRERKRIRAMAYRLKKKQRENERETSLQMLRNQNMTLWDEKKGSRKKRNKCQQTWLNT